MNEVETLNFRRVTEWLAGEVQFQVSRKWLVAAAAAVGVLLLVALD